MLFPTIIPVINMLAERYGRAIYVVRPEDDLKEEYRQRYLDRGNSDSFLSIFIDGWQERMDAIGVSKGIHLRLRSGEYLTPLAAKLLDQEQNRQSPVPDSVLAELAQEVEERGRELILWLWGMEGGPYALPIGDIDQPQTREFLERAGKAAFDGGLHWLDLYPKRIIQEFEHSGRGGVTWLDGEEQFLEAVVREAEAQLQADGPLTE